jgi:hypothetical protein
VSGSQPDYETNLAAMEKFMPECREVVQAVLPQLSDAEQRRLVHGYLEHIEDRVRLVKALREGGIRRYLAEMRRLLATIPLPEIAKAS